MEQQQPVSQTEMHNFEEYILKYFPDQANANNSTSKKPEEIGIQMARDSLRRVREALSKREAT
jgi:hypothetical protein